MAVYTIGYNLFKSPMAQIIDINNAMVTACTMDMASNPDLICD